MSFASVVRIVARSFRPKASAGDPLCDECLLDVWGEDPSGVRSKLVDSGVWRLFEAVFLVG